MAEQKNALVTIVEQKKGDAWNTRASFMPKNVNVDSYFQRALFEIMRNEQMQEISQTTAGAESIFRCITNALQMGLQIGGQFPQASLMPSYDGRKQCKIAILVPSATGYKFLALSDPAVISDVQCIPVYEKEIDSIEKGDQSTGEFVYKKIWSGETGKIAGCWFIITRLDGSQIGKWVHENDVKKRMEKSPSVMAVKADKIKKENCPWYTWYDEMFISKAYQIALSEYAKLKEGCAMRLAVEGDDEPVRLDDQPGDISDRASARLKNVIDITPKIEDNKPVENKEKKAENKNEKKSSTDDLF